MNITLLKQFNTKLSDGYMGAIRSDGNKSHQYLGDADLAKAIKQSLQAVLTPGLKKSDIRVSKQGYSGGRHIYVTLKLDQSIYKIGRETYMARVMKGVRYNKYTWIKDHNNNDIFHEKYYTLTREQQSLAEELTAEWQAHVNYDRPTHQINQYYINEDIMLNNKSVELLEAVNQVIKAFNYDDSNAMVDYFDTNFYYTINIDWK